jgi:hypothetical protein
VFLLQAPRRWQVVDTITLEKLEQWEFDLRGFVIVPSHEQVDDACDGVMSCFIAVCDAAVHAIPYFALRTGEFVAMMGASNGTLADGSSSGCGVHSTPGAMCSAKTDDEPHCELSFLVADFQNLRVEEVTVMGEHVRFIGVGVFTAGVISVACDKTIVVACQNSDTNSFVVFDYASGAPLRMFGEPGKSWFFSHLFSRYQYGLRITPDGRHIIVPESAFFQARLAVYTVEGVFVTSLCEEVMAICQPCDVCFTQSGEIVVTGRLQQGGSGVTILSPDGSRVLQQVALNAVVDSHLPSPIAVHAHGDRLLVLDSAGFVWVLG